MDGATHPCHVSPASWWWWWCCRCDAILAAGPRSYLEANDATAGLVQRVEYIMRVHSTVGWNRDRQGDVERVRERERDQSDTNKNPLKPEFSSALGQTTVDQSLNRFSISSGVQQFVNLWLGMGKQSRWMGRQTFRHRDGWMVMVVDYGRCNRWMIIGQFIGLAPCVAGFFAMMLMTVNNLLIP